MKKKDVGFHGAFDEASVEVTMRKFKFVLYVSLVGLLTGGTLAILGFISTFGIADAVNLPAWSGYIAYFLTLWIPGLAVATLRVMHVRFSQESPDSYDAYSGQQIARKVRVVAIAGFVCSLLAIYVFIVPIAESMA